MVLRSRRETAAPRLAWLAHAGRLRAALDAAPARGRQLLDTKSDWKVVFPFEIARP